MVDLIRNEVAVVAALVLAAIFVWAAVAKLRSRTETSEDFASLGLSNPNRLAILVPLVELTVAASLVITPGWGGVVAAAMIVGFSTVLLRVLRDPQGLSGTARCACFGGTSRTPLSSSHLVRNGLLLGLAVLACLFSGTTTTVV